MLMKRIKAFGAFWYDFVVGDDWRVAAGAALALALTFVLSHLAHVSTWWTVPVAVLILLPLSLSREIRRHDAAGQVKPH
jgi:hypothetical protein